MPDLLSSTTICLIGLITGFADSTLGNGGLISIPALIALGLPPQIAIATDRMGGIGQSIASLYKYIRARKILWTYVPVFTAISLVSSWIGASLLLEINPALIQKSIGVIILLLLPFLAFNRRLGVERLQTTNLKKIVGYAFYFLLMTFQALFGTGVSPLLFYADLFLFGFTTLEARGVGIIPWFSLSIITFFIFAWHGLVNYTYGIILIISMGVGSYLGAHIVLKSGDLWLKRVMLVIVGVMGIYLIAN
ncbi:MAG TPA: sulfite exporter TauE/SafE family protein [bacterium]|nr:sulfite exporter TauE/SafE family protein [bacterium]